MSRAPFLGKRKRGKKKKKCRPFPFPLPRQRRKKGREESEVESGGHHAFYESPERKKIPPTKVDKRKRKERGLAQYTLLHDRLEREGKGKKTAPGQKLGERVRTL